MKIAISATGATLDAEVDPRFGRCQYFIVVDSETMEFEALDNSSAMASGGAGISAAQAIIGKGIQAVLTGNCGPNAHQVLSSAGIETITGVSGKIKDAIEGYRSGQLTASDQANVPDHFGTGGMSSHPQSPEQELQTLKEQSQAMARQLDDIQRRIAELEKKRE